MWAKIITIKRTKDLNYFSLCALNLFNTWISQFELNYWNKWTLPRHSNLLRCTCITIQFICIILSILMYLIWLLYIFYTIYTNIILVFIYIKLIFQYLNLTYTVYTFTHAHAHIYIKYYFKCALCSFWWGSLTSKNMNDFYQKLLYSPSRCHWKKSPCHWLQSLKGAGLWKEAVLWQFSRWDWRNGVRWPQRYTQQPSLLWRPEHSGLRHKKEVYKHLSVIL